VRARSAGPWDVCGAKAGHRVRFATRHPDELNGLATEIGENVSVGTNKEAVQFGEVVFVAVPFGAGRH
jgi:8-hydroxy-5-deazaflavin:NADPH oxidoreductase